MGLSGLWLKLLEITPWLWETSTRQVYMDATGYLLGFIVACVFGMGLAFWGWRDIEAPEGKAITELGGGLICAWSSWLLWQSIVRVQNPEYYALQNLLDLIQ